MSGRARPKYLYRVIVDSTPPGITDGYVRHPDAKETYDHMNDFVEHPGPLTIPAQLPGVVRHFQSLAATRRMVDVYERANCTAHFERSAPITWDTP